MHTKIFFRRHLGTSNCIVLGVMKAAEHESGVKIPKNKDLYRLFGGGVIWTILMPAPRFFQLPPGQIVLNLHSL